MKLSSKKFLFAVGAFALASLPVLGEPRHDSGTGDTFNLSRPSSGTNSAKKVSDIINSCFAGHAGGNPTLGINPGLGEVGGGVGSGGRLPFPIGGGTGAITPPDTASLAPKKCTQCHDAKSAQESIDILNGDLKNPKMEPVLAGLSAGQKAEFLAFFEKRKAEGR